MQPLAAGNLTATSSLRRSGREVQAGPKVVDGQTDNRFLPLRCLDCIWCFVFGVFGALQFVFVVKGLSL